MKFRTSSLPSQNGGSCVMTMFLPDAAASLNHVEGRHHRRRNSTNRAFFTAGLEGIGWPSVPRHAEMLLDSVDNLAGC